MIVGFHLRVRVAACWSWVLRYRRFYQRMFCNKRRYLSLLFLCSFFIYYSSWSTTQLSVEPTDDSTRSTRIMYIIRTSSQFYHKRLIYLQETWLSLVNADAFFVTDAVLPNISHDHLILTRERCGADAHSMNILCCKTAHDFLLFHRYISHYDWFCHFDDDQYVNIGNLEQFLSAFDSNQPYYIGRNSWSDTIKRSKEPYPHPFWFATLGAGVCLSKRSVDLLQPYTSSVQQFVDGCVRENYHDDIYLGFLLNGYLNISLTKSLRFHSHLEKSFYADKQRFLRTFTDEITFGFRSPDRYPSYLPKIYASQSDPYRMRTMHCLLHPQIKECQIQLLQYLANTTL